MGSPSNDALQPPASWGAMDGEQDNGISLLIVLPTHQHPEVPWMSHRAMRSPLPASPFPVPSPLEFLGRAGTAPGASLL